MHFMDICNFVGPLYYVFRLSLFYYPIFFSHTVYAFLIFILDVQDVAIEIKGMIDTFRPYIPLIQGLRNPGMRNRHWEKVYDYVFL